MNKTFNFYKTDLNWEYLPLSKFILGAEPYTLEDIDGYSPRCQEQLRFNSVNSHIKIIVSISTLATKLHVFSALSYIIEKKMLLFWCVILQSTNFLSLQKKFQYILIAIHIVLSFQRARVWQIESFILQRLSSK